MSKQRTSVKLEAQTRTETGADAAKRLRQDGWLPCVVYGPEREPSPVKINTHNFELMLKKTGGHNLIIDLSIDEATPKKALLREIQRDSIKDSLIHADFHEISMTKKLHIEIDVETVGEPVGVTQEGGIVEHLLRTVSVECLPTDIVDIFEVDISGLHIDDTLFVKDIPHDPNITILTPADQPVVSVAQPKVEEEAAAPAAGEGEEGAEGEAAGAEDKAKPEEKAEDQKAEKKGDKKD